MYMHEWQEKMSIDFYEIYNIILKIFVVFISFFFYLLLLFVKINIT